MRGGVNLVAQRLAADIADVAVRLVLDPGPAVGLGEDEHLLAEQQLAVQGCPGIGAAAQVGAAGDDLHGPALRISRRLDPSTQALRGQIVAVGIKSGIETGHVSY
jgi:hypothetical protein